MFKYLLHLFAKAIAVPLIFVLSSAGFIAPTTPASVQPVTTLGAYNPSGGGTYRLQTSAGTSDTTINLSSFKEPISNNPYTMSYFNSSIEYGTLDPQSPTRSEFISFTGITQNANGTAQLTGVTRGLSRSYPYTASSTLALSHAGQSIFILSDTPQLFNQYGVLQNDSVITGQWTAPDPISTQGIATRNYVDGKSFGGIGGATETATGTVQIATNLQAASSTRNGTIGRLALPATIATSTYNSSGSLEVVVTKNNNKIDDNFISTSTLFTNIALASTTNIGSFPAYQIGKNRTIVTATGAGTFTVPSGITIMRIITVGASGGGGGGCSGGGSCTTPGAGTGGGGGGTCDIVATTTPGATISYFIGTGGTGGNTNSGANSNGGNAGTNSYIVSQCVATGGGAGGSSSNTWALAVGGGTATASTTGTNGIISSLNIAGSNGGGVGGGFSGEALTSGGNGGTSANNGVTGSNGEIIFEW